MKIGFISIHPQFLTSYCQFGVLRSALDRGICELLPVNLRDFSSDAHKSVDDRPYGGGEGMVLMAEPLAKAIKSFGEAHVILPSPAGKPFTQKDAERLKTTAQQKPLLFICGRFSGIDQRIVDIFVDEEISLGDFVISGGELAALTFTDAILRLIPGVLGDMQSAHFDSFAQGIKGLEYPLYTRPAEFIGQKVPEVLMSGDHKKIQIWREHQSHKRTSERRPDLL